MLQNFASTYPQVNAAQQGFQGQLGTNLGISNQLNSQIMPAFGAQEYQNANEQQLGQQFQGLLDTSQGYTNNLSKMLYGKGGLGQQNLGIINNAAQGIYANPNLQSAYGTLTGEASGNQPINPIVQQQLMGAGLTNAAQNLAPTSLGTGQTGEAQVARNFGQSAQGYIQNMQNQGLQGLGQLNQDVTAPAQAYLGELGGLQNQSMGQTMGLGNQVSAINQNVIGNEANMIGEAQGQQTGLNAQQSLEAMMFPRTQIGLTGTDFANMMIADTQGHNQFNQANFATQMSAAQYNSQIGAENAGLGASSSSGLISAGISAVAIAALA